MNSSPNYSFNKHPRFSANQLAEYLCTTDAGQREAVIRKAKFPRKVSTAAYQQITPLLRRFLVGNIGNLAAFDDPISRLNEKADRENGYTRDEALRCISALEAFKVAFRKLKMGKAIFLPGPQDLTLKVEALPINVRLDPPIVETGPDDRRFAGGCVLFLAATPEARKNIEERRKHVAATVHWALEESASNVEPLARLCLCFDTFGGEIVRAPPSNERLRRRIKAACREAVNSWERVEPPSGYDGPPWQTPNSN